MIQKYYQIICDYCHDCIDNGMINTKSTIQMAKEQGMIVYKGHHFCCKECLENWKIDPQEFFK